MGKLFAQMSVSLDGFIEDREGGMDWFAGDPAFEEILTATVRGIDGIVFGRKAHALGAAYWPTAAETAESAEVSDQIALMNSLPKYVLSRRKNETDWANSHVIVVDDLPRLKSEAERPLALFAGASALQTLLEAGHIDELRLLQYPVVLGSGTPLFASDGRRRELALVETRGFVRGPIFNRYAVVV